MLWAVNFPHFQLTLLSQASARFDMLLLAAPANVPDVSRED